MGVWIEIVMSVYVFTGLYVTPSVGVWIEIRFLLLDQRFFPCHSLRGSVD